MGAPRERDAARFRGPFERTPGPRSHSFEGRVRVRPGLQSTERPSHGRGPSAREADHVWSRDALASGRAIVRAVDGAGPAGRTDAPGGEGGAPMKAQATCSGAGTIVNAIATGQGAAFGLALRATATVEPRPEEFGVNVHVPPGVDPALAMAASRRVLGRRGTKAGLEVFVDSEIPISRGLKSSSAVANAVILAGATALGLTIDPMDVAKMSVDAAFDAGVTITGAFDDACASLLSGICVTDNRDRRLLALDRFPDDLVAVVQIPPRMAPKAGLERNHFPPAPAAVGAALPPALPGG